MTTPNRTVWEGQPTQEVVTQTKNHSLVVVRPTLHLGVPQRQLHRRSGLATLPSVGAIL